MYYFRRKYYGNKKVEIVFRGFVTIVDYSNPDKPKIINKRK